MAPAGQLISDWSDVPAGQLRAGTSFGPVVLPPPPRNHSVETLFYPICPLALASV